MAYRFAGTYEELKVRLLELAGSWQSSSEDEKQFRHDGGGVMRWHRSTGALHFAGSPREREALEAAVARLLTEVDPGADALPGEDAAAHEHSPPPTHQPANPERQAVVLGRRFLDSELIIGLVGAVGTELNKVVDILEARLKVSSYQVQHVRISHEIIPQLVSVPDRHSTDEYTRISSMMNAGNHARRLVGDNSILALGAAAWIAAMRDKGNDAHPVPRHAPRRAYIINSLKHPDEVLRLREIYPQGFYLLGVHSDESRRCVYLTDEKRIAPQKAQELMLRDEDEHLSHGQRVADTFHLSDFFVRLDGHDDRLKSSVWRILDLLFGDPYKTPTFDEYAMFLAFAAALRSADLSRQVGAVIAKNGEVIATGANDCPRFGGGLYWPEFDEKENAIKDRRDGRDYMRGGDSNRIEQRRIIEEILTKAAEKGIPRGPLQEALEASRISDLTEFGRVVHAEMEALLSCARSHVNASHATLYCTTFPCHNCAKHIIAAGIGRVVYIEPYQKSKAIEFHRDAIEAGFKCEAFVGVGPRRFFDLFSMRLGSGYALKRKDADGQVLPWKPETGCLRLQMLPCTYLDLELVASSMFNDVRRKEDPRDGQ
jgi:deoxycytidylate deaminase